MVNSMGVYALFYPSAKELYVGKSKNIERRWKVYKKALIKNKPFHTQDKLSKWLISHNQDEIEFMILEDNITDETYLAQRELYYWALFKGFGYTMINDVKPSNYYMAKIEQIDIHSGKVVQVFDNIKEAAKSTKNNTHYGVVMSAISRCIKGQQKTAYGYKWRMLDTIIIA